MKSSFASTVFSLSIGNGGDNFSNSDLLGIYPKSHDIFEDDFFRVAKSASVILVFHMKTLLSDVKLAIDLIYIVEIILNFLKISYKENDLV
jgi:hypothetical protein